MKIFFLLFVWGPALLGFSLGWLIRHPEDWTGPAIVGPAGALLTMLTFAWGAKRVRTLGEPVRHTFLGAMIAAAAVGLVILAMLAFRLIG